MSIVEVTIYCTKCKIVINPTEDTIVKNEQIHRTCKEAFENYIPPSTCRYCYEILENPGICLLCKLGNYNLGGWMYRLIRLEDGTLRFIRDYYREPRYIHIYNSIEEFKMEKMKQLISKRMRRTWQIATVYLGENKEYGLKKREYLQKKYTYLCKCRVCKPKKSNKGEKKERQNYMKFYG